MRILRYLRKHLWHDPPRDCDLGLPIPWWLFLLLIVAAAAFGLWSRGQL